MMRILLTIIALRTSLNNRIPGMNIRGYPASHVSGMLVKALGASRAPDSSCSARM